MLMYGRSSRYQPPIRAERFIRYCAVGGVKYDHRLDSLCVADYNAEGGSGARERRIVRNCALWIICTQQTFYISIFGLFAGANSTILSLRRPKFSHSPRVDNRGVVAVSRDHYGSG
jgi:hypothetical protein